MAQNPIVGFQLVSAASMAVNITSPVQVCEFQDNIGIQMIWSGTPTGTFGVQVSCNYNPNTKVGTFTQLTLSPVPAATGAAGSYFTSLTGLPAAYYQVTYTAGSGTGSLDVWVSGKGL